MSRLWNWFTRDSVITQAEADRVQAGARARGNEVYIDARIVPALPEPPPEPCARAVPEAEAGP